MKNEKISLQILSRQEVFPNQFNFVVALKIRGGSHGLCGGTIISENFIITTAYW